MLRFVSVLQSGPTVSLGRVDYPRWSANSSGVFSVSSLYNSATVGLCSGSRPSKLLWNNGLPPKVQFFGWLAWKHRIKVSVFLRRIGVFAGGASSLCCFCKTEEESVLHVLLHCSFVWEVWSSVLAWWGLKWVIPGSVANLLSWWEGGTFLKHEKKIWRSVPLVALWSIWKLRNECTFNGAIADVGDLSELIKARVAIWLVSSSKGWNYSVSDFIYNLNQVRACIGGVELSASIWGLPCSVCTGLVRSVGFCRTGALLCFSVCFLLLCRCRDAGVMLRDMGLLLVCWLQTEVAVAVWSS
ncbi:uncharacterized protein LOC114265699 [Camellia sinensis]|uniref:uncharacterized protein LOC114265699 n=1 Tax=Camellia sinensis TaxID=4442 RepID=UPI00103587C1|nr:uncharacterized protein LOC114265699 [Camellia sinensis]XP_028062317.1 uncharacterized protein LOC114265699 [Camellia sinensis]